MDKKAKKILFDRYWASGWKPQNEIYTSPEDFAYAKEKVLCLILLQYHITIASKESLS